MTKSLRSLSHFLIATALAFVIGGVSLLLPNAAGTAYADESGTSTLAFTSDVHNNTENTARNRMNTWLANLPNEVDAEDIEVFGFCGDMGHMNTNESQFWTCTQAIMTAVEQNGIPGVYTTGNHEFYNGNYSSTTNSVKNGYIVDNEGMEGSNYRIYCLGTDNWNSNKDNYTADQISALRDYLNRTDNDKVIIILTHFPLHYWGGSGWGGGRSTTNADQVIDLLNDATADGKKIVLLWGHNHSQSDTNYDEVFAPESTIQYGSNSSQTKTFDFYYAAAGCMSDTEYTGSTSVKGKGLILEINSKNQLSFSYFDASGNNVTENGTDGQGTAFTEQDPVAVTGVSIDQTSATVEAGKTITLTATVEPADATNKTVTWSSSDESIARVDSNGRVRGISEGTATITATAGEPGTRALFSDSIEVEVTPRSTDTQYYVITIGTKALSSHASPEMTSNTSGYEYHGLDAVEYDADEPAPWSILWTIEEVEGVPNGYYIKSYNGEYLSASYVSNGTAYTGRLTVGDTEDIWIIDGGLAQWQGNGSYLQSTNASDNPRPADIYLTTRQSDSQIEFFTVGSSQNYKTSKLIEPESIVDPIAVTGIEVTPSTLEIEAGKSSPLTAHVLPENADDKTVTWTSSDESIATVTNAGRVKGISAGTATITATTADGNYSDTCEVTVTPSTAPGIGYVITINDYALSTEPASSAMVNNNYRYDGLAGVPYDESTELTDEILWLIEPTEGGYYIMSQDGRYLNAVYETLTDPAGCNAALKLDDTPDVWTFEGSLEDWVLSGSTLHSTNANKYMTHEEGGTSAPLNLFTIRSTGESSSMIDPDNPAEVRYVETNALASGRDYIIAATKDGNGVYAIANITGTSSGNTGSVELTNSEQEYYPAAGSEPAYIITGDSTVVWNYTANRYLSNSSRYLARTTSGTIVPRVSGQGRAFTYTGDNQRLALSQSGTFYLTNSNGTFGYTQTAGNAGAIRIFEKTTVFNFKYVVQFVSNGVNWQSTKYAAGEVPVYSGTTPTREDSAQYTYVFSGWSSDGGVTVYGPEDALPAVTGPVTYVAQFTAVPKSYIITWKDADGTVLETDEDVAPGAVPTFDGDTPTKAADEQFRYTFAGWNPEVVAAEANATYTATYTQTPRTYGDPVWTWTGDDEAGYTAANAAFTTNDGEAEFTQNVPDNEIDVTTTAATCTEDGSTVYAAAVEFGGEQYTDSKTVVIPATGHAWGEISYEWNADHSSVTATRICGNDSTHVETETVAATSEVTKPATCTEKGETTYTSAAFENEAFEVQAVTLENVDALGHDWAAPTYKWSDDNHQATATRVCNHDSSHTESVTVETASQVTKPATCEEVGETTYTATFSDPFETQTKTEADIPATGHAWGEWTAVNEQQHKRVCENDETHVETANHEWDEGVITEPTCEEGGYTTYTCNVCGTHVIGDPVEPLGHDWGTVSYEWDGLSSVTATRVCGNDSTHVETETVEVTSEVTKPATCEEMGQTTYTAAFENEAFETQSKTETDVPALGHKWGETEYTWADDNSSVTATRVCEHDATHVETETVSATSEVTKPATCVAKGETTYTSAAFENEAFEVQVKTEEDVAIDPDAHDWDEATYEWADDNASVTAARTCKLDATHIETETVAATSEVTKPATCVAKGETTYTSEAFENEAFEVQVKTEENIAIDENAHDWGEWTPVDGEDVHQRICALDEEHTETADHEWDDGVVTTDPTSDEAGVKTYTCEACEATKTESLDPIKISYRAGVEGSTKWQAWKSNGETAGTVGQGLRMEGLQIELENAPYPGGIRYKSQLQSDGWEKNWAEDGATSGYAPKVSGGKRLEAVQIELYGEMAEHYDVWYHLQVQRFGWMGWVKNGEVSGTVGYAFRVETLEMVLAPKGSEAPTTGSAVKTSDSNMLSFVRARSYDNATWQGAKGEGDVSGTRKQSKTQVRVGLASSSLSAAGIDRGDSYVQVRVFQDGKWSAWSTEDDAYVGNAKGGTIRGIQARIAPGTTLESQFDLYYRAEVKDGTGNACWLGWAVNGETAGQKNINLEQLSFSLVPKGEPAPPANADELQPTNAHAKQTWVIERWPCNWPKPNYRF